MSNVEKCFNSWMQGIDPIVPTPEEIADNDAKNCRISDHIINIKRVNLTDKNGSGTRRFYDVTEAYLQSNECNKTFVIL